MQTLTITRPDDWHLHLRDGAALAAVLPDTVRRFARAIVMPNLKPPVTTVALAAAYRQRILDALAQRRPRVGQASTTEPPRGESPSPPREGMSANLPTSSLFKEEVRSPTSSPSKAEVRSPGSSPFKGEVRRGMGSEAAEYAPIHTPTLPLKGREKSADGLEPTLMPHEGGMEGGGRFTPLMTLYLTDNMPPAEVDAVKASGFVHAIKLYPAGATTNSDAGVSDLKKCAATLARMEKLGVPLLVHGEVNDPAVDIFDREAVFIDTVLMPLLRDFPALKVVLEHVTTREGIEFVHGSGANVAGTLTAHHLLLNRNALFAGGIRPHHYCLPVLKRESHRQALLAAAISGSPKFFLGTDSAPHAQGDKEAACGCAGCYTAHAGIELYAEAFEAAGALERLEAFASFHGADWYGLPRNTEKITLLRDALAVPASLDYADGDRLVPLRAGESVAWRLE